MLVKEIYESSQYVTDEEMLQIKNDLEKSCALDTYAVVKIIEKLYDAVK